MLLTEIDHVAIAVSDLEAAIDYYERAFGATVAHREVVECDGVEEALLKVGRQLHPADRGRPARTPRSPSSSRSAARACTTSATASTTAPPRWRRWSPPAPRRSTRRPAPGQPRHDRRVHPPQGQLRHADRARPGVSAAPAGDRRDAPTAAPVAAPPAAVLWDMDGTLVDTEPYWMACEHELVAAFGGTWTDDDARSIIGFDLLDAAVVLRDRGGVDLEPQEIVERLLDGVDRPRPRARAVAAGRAAAADELNAQGVPCALVTMSWRRLVDAVVEALAPITFQAVVTGDAVEHGKPHPEPYLLAAAALGVDPAAVRGDRGLPDRRRRRPARPAASSSPSPTSSPIDPAPGRDHRAHR